MARVRKGAVAELKVEAAQVLQREKVLKNVSESSEAQWKKLQGRTRLLSLLRIILKQTRVYGLVAKLSYQRLGRVTTRGLAAVKRRLILYPDSCLLRVHQTVMVICMLYSLLLTPLNAAFDLQLRHPAVEASGLVVCFVAAFDFFLRFFVAVTSGEKLCDSHMQIAALYLKSRFAFYLVASLPLDFLTFRGSFTAAILVQIARTLRLTHASFAHKGDNPNYLKDFVGKRITSAKRLYVLNSLAVTILIIHWSACIWASLRKLSDARGWHSKYPRLTADCRITKRACTETRVCGSTSWEYTIRSRRSRLWGLET